jgi:hypothetical protein
MYLNVDLLVDIGDQNAGALADSLLDHIIAWAEAHSALVGGSVKPEEESDERNDSG